MTITDRAQKVLTEIDAALAMAEKATPGPWMSDRTAMPSQNLMIRGNDLEAKMRRSHQMDSHDATFIATSRTLLPASLRCLRTAIEEMLKWHNPDIDSKLTTLCDQWDASRLHG